MTRHPFDSGELGRNEPEMDRAGEFLERYAVEASGEPPMDLASRIRDALDNEPAPARGWWASLLALFAPWHGPARFALATTVLAAAVLGALVVEDLADRARVGTGSSPTPSVTVGPTPTLSPTPSPSPTPTSTSIPTELPSPTSPAAPSPSEDHGGGTETPRPSESDNSGPGGGNSGSGGGD